jgi:hypothetical protein
LVIDLSSGLKGISGIWVLFELNNDLAELETLASGNRHGQ